MSTAIIPGIKEYSVPALPAQVLEDFESSSFLPNIRICASNSKMAQSGKAPGGDFVLVKGKEDITPLGKTIDIIPIDFRSKAVDMRGKTPITVYDSESEAYKELVRIAKSSTGLSDVMAGVEFLLYYKDMFVTYFCANKSSWSIIAELHGYIRSAATLKAQFTENAKGAWFAPKVQPCGAELDPPDPDELDRVLKKFRNPEEGQPVVQAAPATPERPQ